MQSRQNFLKTCAVGFNVAVICAIGVGRSWAVDAKNEKAAHEAKDTVGALADQFNFFLQETMALAIHGHTRIRHFVRTTDAERS